MPYSRCNESDTPKGRGHLSRNNWVLQETCKSLEPRPLATNTNTRFSSQGWHFSTPKRTYLNRGKNQPNNPQEPQDFTMKAQVDHIWFASFVAIFLMWKQCNKKAITLEEWTGNGAAVRIKHINPKQKQSIKMSVCADEIIPICALGP